MTSDPIRAAIEQLRDSIEALPEFAKREQWRADKRHHSRRGSPVILTRRGAFR